jgi:hypothetical protein
MPYLTVFMLNILKKPDADGHYSYGHIASRKSVFIERMLKALIKALETKRLVT